jgi:hypothetical protein
LDRDGLLLRSLREHDCSELPPSDSVLMDATVVAADDAPDGNDEHGIHTQEEEEEHALSLALALQLDIRGMLGNLAVLQVVGTTMADLLEAGSAGKMCNKSVHRSQLLRNLVVQVSYRQGVGVLEGGIPTGQRPGPSRVGRRTTGTRTAAAQLRQRQVAGSKTLGHSGWEARRPACFLPQIAPADAPDVVPSCCRNVGVVRGSNNLRGEYLPEGEDAVGRIV